MSLNACLLLLADVKGSSGPLCSLSPYRALVIAPDKRCFLCGPKQLENISKVVRMQAACVHHFNTTAHHCLCARYGLCSPQRPWQSVSSGGRADLISAQQGGFESHDSLFPPERLQLTPGAFYQGKDWAARQLSADSRQTLIGNTEQVFFISKCQL